MGEWRKAQKKGEREWKMNAGKIKNGKRKMDEYKKNRCSKAEREDNSFAKMLKRWNLKKSIK